MAFTDNYFPKVIGGQNNLMPFANREPMGMITSSPQMRLPQALKGVPFADRQFSQQIVSPPEDERTYGKGMLRDAFTGVTQIFEPIQVGQDFVYATVAGMKDGTLSQRYASLWDNLPSYFDPTKVAPRPVSGSDILKLYGVQNESVARYAGLGLDIFADPFLLGNFLSAGGKLLKVAGALDTGNDLIKIGNATERAMSLLGPVDLARAGLRKYSPRANAAINDAMKELVVKIAGIKNPLATNKGAARLSGLDWWLPERRALQAEFMNVPGAVEGATDAGKELSQIKAVAQMHSTNLEDSVMEAIHEFEELLKPAPKTWLNTLTSGFKGYEKAEQLGKGFNPVVAAAIQDRVYELNRVARLGGNTEKAEELVSFLGKKQEFVTHTQEDIARTVSNLRQMQADVVGVGMFSGFNSVNSDQKAFLGELADKLNSLTVQRGNLYGMVKEGEDAYRTGQQLAKGATKSTDKMLAGQENLAGFNIFYNSSEGKQVIDGDIVAHMLEKFRVNPSEARNAIGSLAFDSLDEAPVIGFKTSKGSSYQITPDGKTVRNKAKRPEHTDSGLKAKSDATVYVDKQKLDLLAPPSGSEWRYWLGDDGSVSVLTKNQDGRWGRSPSQTNVPVQKSFAVGLHPLEMWNADNIGIGGGKAFKEFHAGNEIVEVLRDTPKTFPSGKQIKGGIAQGINDIISQAGKSLDSDNVQDIKGLVSAQRTALTSAILGDISLGVPRTTNPREIEFLAELENKLSAIEIQQSAVAGTALPAALIGSDKAITPLEQLAQTRMGSAFQGIQNKGQAMRAAVLSMMQGGVKPGEVTSGTKNILFNEGTQSLNTVKRLVMQRGNGKKEEVTLGTIKGLLQMFNSNPDEVMKKVSSMVVEEAAKKPMKSVSKSLNFLEREVRKLEKVGDRKVVENELVNLAYSQVENQKSVWRKTEQEVYELALKKGDNPVAAVDALRKGYKIIAEAETKVGRALSMVDPIKAHFIQHVSATHGVSLDDSAKLWNAIEKQGMANALAGEAIRASQLERIVDPVAVNRSVDMDPSRLTLNSVNLDELYKSVTGASESPFMKVSTGEVTRTAFGIPFKVEGEKSVPMRLGEVLGTNKTFGRISLDDLFRGEAVGHLRRSFGMMLDDAGKEKFLKSLEQKKLVPSSLVQTPVLLEKMKAGGFEKEGALITEYFDALRGGEQTRGLVRSIFELKDYLVKSGVEPKQAVKAIENMQENIGSEAYGQFIKNARAASERHLQRITGGTPGRESPSGIKLPEVGSYEKSVDFEFESASYLRDQLGRNPTIEEVKAETLAQLEYLNELAMPSASLLEQVRSANRQVPLLEFTESLGNLIKRYPALASDVVSDSTPVRLDDIPELGPVAGKYVNEFLAKEIHRFYDPKARGLAMQRINALQSRVTAGMLAGPASIFANVPGGIAMTTLQGLNPIDMLWEMGRTAKDLWRAAKNPSYHFQDLDDFQSIVNLKISNLANADMLRDNVEDIALNRAGMGRDGFAKLINDFDTQYQKWFIEKPLGLPIGLKTFGFTENLMKISAYRVAKKMGMSIEEAAEIGRISTFDQSQLPELLKMFKEFGGPFPGFPYFTAGRLASAAIQHPGNLGAMDRLGSAITEASIPDESERMSLYAGMDEWLKQPQNRGVPLWISEDKAGNKTAHVIPLGQLLPTSTSWNESFLETAATFGLAGPIFELLNAHISGDGEAIFSRKYGQKVFNPTSGGVERFGESLAFLYNAFAPAIAKKLINYNVKNQEVRGLLPAITEAVRQSAIPVPMDMVTQDYTAQEYRQRKVERSLLDEVISTFIRSSTPVTLEGAIPGFKKQYETEKRDVSYEVSALKTRMKREMEASSPVRHGQINQKYIEKISKIEMEFNTKWQERFSVIGSR